jgi:hypothetical protein
MRLTKSLLCGVSALALATAAAFAGEDSTQRWHGTGGEYHDNGGLQLFSDADAVGSDQFSEPMRDSYSLSESDRLSLSEPDLIYIYPTETVVVMPDIETAIPQGS